MNQRGCGILETIALSMVIVGFIFGAYVVAKSVSVFNKMLNMDSYNTIEDALRDTGKEYETMTPQEKQVYWEMYWGKKLSGKEEK